MLHHFSAPLCAASFNDCIAPSSVNSAAAADRHQSSYCAADVFQPDAPFGSAEILIALTIFTGARGDLAKERFDIAIPQTNTARPPTPMRRNQRSYREANAATGRQTNRTAMAHWPISVGPAELPQVTQFPVPLYSRANVCRWRPGWVCISLSETVVTIVGVSVTT